MNVLIVEDEKHTANLLLEIIEQDPDFLVVDMLESVAETVTYLGKRQHNIDLIFLDIHLADGLSFEIFRNIDVVRPVVFCTAYDEYTLQAIKNNGIDYVLKPFKEEEIHHALKKYKRLVDNLQARSFSPVRFEEDPTRYQQMFLTQSREKSLVKKVSEIALFAVEFEMVYMYTFQGEKHPLFKKLEYIESVCDPEQFYRINRQMLVNRDAIVSFEPYHNRKVVLQLGVKTEEQPVVSRTKVTFFKEWLEH